MGNPERYGSVTLASAVSPPGGDFTEPVTSTTLRFVRVFWPLDVSLAQARHYPAINWLQGFSSYVDLVADWWTRNVDPDWKSIRDFMVRTLIREDELRQIVRLVGPESLAEKDKLALETARLIKEAFLKQNAYDDVDAFSSPQKQMRIMKLIYHFYQYGYSAVEKGVLVKRITEKVTVVPDIIRSKATIKNNELEKYDELESKLKAQFDELMKEVGA